VTAVFRPRPYQELAYQHLLAHERCNLWADMGLGKTASTLTVLDYMYRFGYEHQPTLVLAPKRVARSVWPQEARKWAHLDLHVSAVIGSAAQRAQALLRDAQVYTINYDNVPWLVEHLGARWPFCIVVADESTRLKSHRLRGGGVRAAALSKIAFRPVRRWFNLTGTPAPNGLLDLWGQQWFVDAGKRLGKTFTAFKERWFYPHPSGFGVKPRENAQTEIQKRLADCTLTIKSADWFALDEPLITIVEVELPKPAMKLYKDMEREMYVELAKCGVEAFNSASKTIKCLQMANGALYTSDGLWEEVHSAKLEALNEIVEEAAGAPLIVAYQFKHDLARILKRFPQARTLDTEQDEAAWNAGEIPLLVMHPESAGHGLNLQDGGHRIVFFGLWWALEPHQQIIERVGPVRQMQSGYKRTVMVYYITAAHTVDQDVIQVLRTKASVQDVLQRAMRRAA